MKNLFAVRLRVSERRSTVQSKSGPKAYPQGEVDGKRVNIPVPACTKTVTESNRVCVLTDMHVEAFGR